MDSLFTLDKVVARIKKLFEYVKSSEYACNISAIAIQAFLSNLFLVSEGKRSAIVKIVQMYLYITYITERDRGYVLRVLKGKINDTGEAAAKKRYQDFLKNFEKSDGSRILIKPADPSNTNPARITTHTNGTNRPSSSGISGTFRLSTSLAGLNLSQPVVRSSLPPVRNSLLLN